MKKFIPLFLLAFYCLPSHAFNINPATACPPPLTYSANPAGGFCCNLPTTGCCSGPNQMNSTTCNSTIPFAKCNSPCAWTTTSSNGCVYRETTPTPTPTPLPRTGCCSGPNQMNSTSCNSTVPFEKCNLPCAWTTTSTNGCVFTLGRSGGVGCCRTRNKVPSSTCNGTSSATCNAISGCAWDTNPSDCG